MGRVLAGFRDFVDDVVRVLRVTRKPSKSEYFLLLRVSILGLAAIGLYGFLILYLSTVIATAIGF
ncbi:MAG: protein translocase SEC61 complex subunit gamma [Candidatus Nezhaarchaeota archaeon]|nr:protein translocase SEC61 complex subunit gamma [Candidatus Nezhaarchaeota archaeon]